MIRSMFTAISALNLNQTYLDVISDNLANSNTTGYKSSRVIFQDQFAEVMSSGAAPSDSSGGINPTQVGLGVKLGYISPTFTQGMLTSTSKSTDLAIEGNGFFMYKSSDNTVYSREGSLEIDSEGYLVNNSTGMRILGWMVDAGSDAVDTNQPVEEMHISLDSTVARATTESVLSGNLSSETTVEDSTASPAVAGGTVETTMAVYDSLGQSHTATVVFTRTGENAWEWEVTEPTGSTGAGTITFTTDGAYSASTTTEDVTIPGSSGSEDVEMTLDLTNITMLSADSSVSPSSQNGLAAGSVSELYGSPTTGEIYLVYSNGLKELVGQLAIASFTNPSGLIRSGQNTFMIGLNSGEPQVGAANTGGRGSVTSGYLEASNVDMAQEFTNMILAQRGFQASARVITTSDNILEELVNLNR